MCVCISILNHVFLNPYTPLMLGESFHIIQNWSQTDTLLNYCSSRFVYHHTNYFLIYTRRNSRRVISSKFASTKLRFEVTRDVYVKSSVPVS